MMSKLWRQLANKPDGLDLKVRTAKAKKVSILLPQAGLHYPLVRTNALPILAWPKECGKVDYDGALTFQELNAKEREVQPNVIWSFSDKLLFWGEPSEIRKMFDPNKIRAVKTCDLGNEGNPIQQSTILKSFYEEALATSLCDKKPIFLRKKGKSHFIVADHLALDDPLLQPLKEVVGYNTSPGPIIGQVPGQMKTFWAESVFIKLEIRADSLWLLLQPDIWISPLKMRETATDFLRKKRLQRWNKQSYHILNAWIKILFGSVGQGQDVVVNCFGTTEFSPSFKISTRTAYSQRV